MPLLFSYGTLQQDGVQLSTFGRRLAGHPDSLTGFEQSLFEVKDLAFVAASGKAHHAIVRFTGRAEHRVPGMAFEVSDRELATADAYEPAGYVRIRTVLASGKEAWVYVASSSAPPAANGDRPADLELMRLHVEALFTHDANGDLTRVNEPSGAAAPRFFVGRTGDGILLRFRHDVATNVRHELEALTRDDASLIRSAEPLPNVSRYVEILARSAPVERTWSGPTFTFPDPSPVAGDADRVTAPNASVLEPELPAWLPDVAVGQPMFAVVVDGRAVSVCCTVRVTERAYEAGVETASAHRGRGYAARATAAWARAVRDMGRVPLYSTSWQNTASRAVARKLGLIRFGSDLHFT